MYHKNIKRNMGISVLILALVSLTIGYAIISSNLQLNGNAEIANMAWNIYFDNISVTDGSTGLSVPTLSSDKTSVSFTTSFTEPTDYYDFTLDLINDGTLAAKVDSVTLSGLTTEQDVYANYRVTYVGGGAISAGDTLNPGEVRQVRVRLEMDLDVDATSLPSEATTLSLSAKINFVQGEEVNYLYDLVASTAVVDNVISPYVTGTNGIDFSAVSSDTNGKGIYTLSSTINDTYPIYYYRGAVENNNVIFGGYCWKIVRTTETGGVKLIYNGTPTDATCVATGEQTIVKKGAYFTHSWSSDTDLFTSSYMFSNVDFSAESGKIDLTSSLILGKNIKYENGSYTLLDTTVSTGSSDFSNGYRYTCYSTSAISCSSVRYYFIEDHPKTYLLLSNGMTMEKAVASFTTNSTNDSSSKLKTEIDDWYLNNLISRKSQIEDSVYCGDRSVYSYGAHWNDTSVSTSFTLNTLYRTTNGKPSLTCENNSDRYSVYAENGNSDLTYPIASLNVDELMLAGFNKSTATDSYLYSDETFYTMSTSTIGPESTGPKHYGAMFVVYDGKLYYDAYLYPNPTIGQVTDFGIRPAISLKVGTTYTGGTGTTDDPYIIG